VEVVVEDQPQAEMQSPRVALGQMEEMGLHQA
jgi:hypothetical protein